MKLFRVIFAFTLAFFLPATIVFAGPIDTSVYLNVGEGGTLDYVAPDGYIISSVDFASYGTPQGYSIGWCHAENSLEIVDSYATDTILQIDASNNIFGDPCGGTYKWLQVVLTIDIDPDYIVPTPEPTEILPTYTPTPSETPTENPTITPEPTPSETVEPTPTVTPTLSPSPEPSHSISPTPSSTPVSSLTPVPASPSESPTPQESPTLLPIVIPSDTPTPSSSPTLEPTPTPDPLPTPDPTDTAAVADALVTQYADTAIPADVFAASGLTYADLPPDQPVTLPNGVVLTAGVADAIQIFKSASAVLSAVFTDPGRALKAIANVGADMTPATRKKAQQAAVPAVIVTQIISGTASLLIRKP